MPSFNHRVENGRVIIGVSVSLTAPATYRCSALVDTGATRTMITRKTATSIGAVPVGRANFLPANGQPTPTNVYAINLEIPVDHPDENAFAVGGPLFVLELPFQPKDWGVLLGMDVLTQHHITLYRTEFIMSI